MQGGHMRWQRHLLGTELLPPKATPLRALERDEVSLVPVERRTVQPCPQAHPKAGVFKALTPSTLLPMGQRVHTGVPTRPALL